MEPTRRQVLSVGAGGATAALAGCLDTLGLVSGEEFDGYTAFFSLWDWTQTVAGDDLEFENPVGTGEMGHGWSPDGDIVPRIADTDLFIYLDTVEFQWALRAAETLERDHADDVILVNALEGLGPRLLPFDTGGRPEPARDRTFDREELAFGEFEIWDLRTDVQQGWWHVTDTDAHWHGSPPDVAVGDEVPVGIVLYHVNDESLAAPLGEDEQFRVDARIADGDTGALEIVPDGDRILLRGESTGEARLVFEFYEGDELVYDTAADPTPVSVVEEYDDSPDPDSFDPHAWVDPVLAAEMVGTIADALAEYNPDNADTYRQNAAAYREDLAAIDEQFEQLVADAELDVAVFAGHDSYRYIEHRYEFELVTPTGVSPNEAASLDDISGLVEVIEDNGIDTVLYDPFEAAQPGEDLPRLVEAIFENSQAGNAEPLTPVEGVTEEWAENGWGWVEQMEEINLPSLERALNPE